PAGTKQATVIADSNLRSGPSASSKKLDRLAKGSLVDVLARDAGSNWFKVATPGGKTGYVAGDRIKLAENSPEPAEQPPSESQLAPSVAQSQPEPAPPPSVESAQPEISQSGSGEGDRFADCDPGCPEMVRIPSGSFEMGSNGEASERPVHPVNVKGFAIGRREITVGEWRACSDGGGCPPVSEANASDAPDAPMHNLSWDDATAYVTWLSKKTGKRYRLPSESEWEFAARAGTTGPYWWGSKIDAQFVSCKDCGGPYDKLAPPTRGVQPNPFGLVNVSGGVAEWVMDCWKPNHDGAPSDGTAREGNCGERVLRGGSWRDDHSRVTVTSRGKYDHDVRYLNNGFRIARDLD
ncbi:MAG: SUMF1/EgtB/PvdO family nonheme iron enzyme, partial [Hyphomicrobiales bacterium]